MSLLDNLKRVLKTEQPTLEVIVKIMPSGFFTLRREGMKDVLAHNSVFGLLIGVRDHFYVGHKYFQRERDAKGALVPLPVFVKPRAVFGNFYGNFQHGDKRIIDTETTGFSGTYDYKQSVP
jgi:hypothetical protein